MTEDEFEEALEALIRRSGLSARSLTVVLGELKDRYADEAGGEAPAPQVGKKAGTWRA